MAKVSAQIVGRKYLDICSKIAKRATILLCPFSSSIVRSSFVPSVSLEPAQLVFFRGIFDINESTFAIVSMLKWCILISIFKHFMSPRISL